MRAAGAGLIAALLALVGCKSADQKGDPVRPFAGAVGKGKDVKDKEARAKEAKGGTTGLAWLDDGKLPGAGTGVPKGPIDPAAAKADAQDALGGRVLDPAGKPARNVFVRIDRVGAPANDPAAVGIYTNNEGYFFTRGFKAGQAYELTVEATQDGKALAGVVQTKVPNAILTIVLRDDLSGAAGAPKGSDGTFPPDPRPSEKVGEAAPKPAAPKSSDGAWAPGGAITGVPPATIGNSGAAKAPAPPAAGALPPPDDLSAPPKPVRPENTAEGPRDPFKPPAANIPNPGGPPAVPPLPALPPSFNPSGSGGKSSQNNATTAGGAAGKLVLLDTLERPWELESARPGSLVLVEFITSTCVPCKEAIPVLKDVQSRYGAGGLQVAAVLCDELPQKKRAELASKYGRDFNLNYAVYVEPGAAGAVRDRYGVESYPTAVLLNPAGKVLWRGHPGEKVELESAIKRHLGK